MRRRHHQRLPFGSGNQEAPAVAHAQKSAFRRPHLSAVGRSLAAPGGGDPVEPRTPLTSKHPGYRPPPQISCERRALAAGGIEVRLGTERVAQLLGRRADRDARSPITIIARKPQLIRFAALASRETNGLPRWIVDSTLRPSCSINRRR